MLMKQLWIFLSPLWSRQFFTMCTSQADALSHWCLSDDLSESVWIDNIEAFKLLDTELEQERNVTLEEILSNSKKFPIEFPIESVRCKELMHTVSSHHLERYANSVYPVLHEKILELCAQFILHKRGPAGSTVERFFYKDMDIPSFINRLLTKRAVLFMGSNDSYKLLDGTTGAGAWETIGTDKQQPPLLLEDYLSYSEIKISAFLSVSSYTYFLNSGDRMNEGVLANDRDDVEYEGIIMGLIGTRFEKPNVMDYQEIIHDGVHRMQTNPFFNIYNEVYVSYECLQQKTIATASRFTEYKPDSYFDDVIYVKRLALSFDTLLQEANARAKSKDVSAYVHVVGIGLGVWKISDHQQKVFIDSCVQRIKQFANRLHFVSDICFAHISVPEKATYKDGDLMPGKDHPNGGIKIHISNREPHEKLKDQDKGKLLVVSYAWDGNALPGNEFWSGSLSGSGDPAAACSTQVAELHNAHINPKLRASALRVVTPTGLVTLKEYQEKVRKLRT